MPLLAANQNLSTQVAVKRGAPSSRRRALKGMLASVLAGSLAGAVARAARAYRGPNVAPAHAPTPVPASLLVPDREGAMSWKLLVDVKRLYHAEALPNNRFRYSVQPVYRDEVRQAAGKTVRLVGYVIPLQTSRTQNELLLSGVPQDCAFCGPGFPETFALVRGEGIAIPKDGRLITLEGRFELADRTETNGIFYRLIDAKLIES